VNDRNAGEGARIGGEKLRCIVVSPLEHEVVVAHELDSVLRHQSHGVEPQFDRRRERLQLAGRGLDLRRAHVGETVEDLAMKVRSLDHVVIAEAKNADSR
jgi:hypothetical protein